MLLLSLAIAAAAQNSIKVNAPNLVAVDEQFNVTFIIEGENKPSDFSWDSGEDFQLVWGPQRGSSSSVTIVNGKRTSTSQTTYTYVLMPRRTGTFQMPSARCTVKGEELVSKKFSIQVVSDGAQSQQSQGSQTQGQQQSRSADPSSVSSEDIFMKLYLSKSKVVVGETITATLKLFQRVNIAGFEDAKFPTFNGFWSQEMQAPSNIEFKRENVGERIFNTAVLRSWTLIPQRAGDIKIDPAELVCLVNVRAARSSSNSIFDSFFQDDYQTIRKRVSTPAVTVHVSKVPAGAPASFGGGVGTFKMNASLTRSELAAHDAASLKVTITGKGNISLLEAPKVDFPPDFEVYDVKTTEAAGSKTFEFPFIPRSHGDFVLGPVEYSYYDVSAGKYVTLRSEPMPLKVSRGAETAPATGGGQLVSNPSRKDVRDVGSDIRFISTAMPTFSRKGYFFVGSGLFWLILSLLVLFAAVLYFALRGAAARRADVAGSRNRAATKMARKRLSQAGEFLNKDLYTAFYEELHKALLGYVSDKLTMNASEMSKDNIADRLKEGGVSDETASQFVALIDACEFARYSPSEGHDAMKAHYESAVAVISTIDGSMKKKKHKASIGAVVSLFLLLPFGTQAAESADSLWTRGCEAYTEGRWSEALECWTEIYDSGSESPELYYNIGNSYFKSSDYARAILWYERALKVDPSCSDARYNLEFAQDMIQDRIESVPEFILEAWGRKACYLLPSGTWAVLCIVFFALALGLLLLFLLAGGGARKAGFFGALVALLLSLLCLDFASWQKKDGLRQDSAIVLAPVVSVKSSPGSESAKDLFVIHEGTKVRILDAVGEWRNIELADGRQGWMKSSDAEVI